VVITQKSTSQKTDGQPRLKNEVFEGEGKVWGDGVRKQREYALIEKGTFVDCWTAKGHILKEKINKKSMTINIKRTIPQPFLGRGVRTAVHGQGTIPIKRKS